MATPTATAAATAAVTTSTSFAHLLPPNWDEAIPQWLHEDTPTLDWGGFVVGEQPEEAILFCKAAGVLAGRPFVTRIFEYLKCDIEWFAEEGQLIDKVPFKAARVRGPARLILLGERVALNLIARTSGIATRARALRQLADERQWGGVIAATRKTTPGFRLYEKYAAIVGGADPHRFDLSACVMLKDNHVNSVGSITTAVHTAKRAAGFTVKIHVECQNTAEALEALAAGADIVMLDNVGPADLHAQAAAVKQQFPAALVEASGGITLQNVAEYFGPHIDVISMGSLTQGVPHIDFSLKILPKQKPTAAAGLGQ